MPRKYFRKYLPDHATIRDHRHLRWAGSWLKHPNLWHLNRASVAGGVAVGMIGALVPGPVQMLSAALLALLFRVNLPVAMATTLISNPLTWPFIILAALFIGEFLLGTEATGSPINIHFDWSDWGAFLPEFWHWLLSLGEAFLLGEIILAGILAVLGYSAVHIAWRLYLLAYLKRRRQRHEGR